MNYYQLAKTILLTEKNCKVRYFLCEYSIFMNEIIKTSFDKNGNVKSRYILSENSPTAEYDIWVILPT